MRAGFVLNDSRPALPQSADLQIKYESSHTVTEVYKGAARHIIRKTDHLEVLCACQNPKGRDNIPSWAPDWTTPRVNGPLVVPDTWGRIYAASGDERLSFKQGNDANEIILKGMWVNNIEKVGPVRDVWSDVKDKWAMLAMACAKARPDGTMINAGEPVPMDAHCLYSTGERNSDAFLRTCVVDRIEEFRVEPGQHVDKSGLISTPLGSRRLWRGTMQRRKGGLPLPTLDSWASCLGRPSRATR